MHVIIALLGAIATAVWILHRLAEMGISLAGLNPFLWRRRRAWSKRYHANPIYQIESPMDLMALLMVAVAKSGGDMSGAERAHILDVFRDVFELSEKDATGLLNASSHLYGRGEEVADHLEKILAPSQERFSDQQRGEALPMLTAVANVDGDMSASQHELIDRVRRQFTAAAKPANAWQG